jgi:hypothetical protein
MFKKQMAGGPGTQKVKNAGKGSQQAPMPNRQAITQMTQNPAATSINDYSKATPMASPQPAPPSPVPPGGSGLGTGNWPGIGG